MGDSAVRRNMARSPDSIPESYRIPMSLTAISVGKRAIGPLHGLLMRLENVSLSWCLDVASGYRVKQVTVRCSASKRGQEVYLPALVEVEVVGCQKPRTGILKCVGVVSAVGNAPKPC